jgi:hypothetical protein
MEQNKTVCAYPTREEIWDILGTHGYMVIPNVVDEATCDHIYDEFLNYLERLCPDFKKNDRSTWTNDNLPIRTRGLLQWYNCGFMDFNIKLHMLVKHIFEEMWGTNELWTSFGGGSFTIKGKRSDFADLADWEKKCYEKTKVHLDQTTRGFLGVQAGVAITEQREDMHVFTCIPGSHLHHDKLLDIEEELAKKTYEKDMEEYTSKLKDWEVRASILKYLSIKDPVAEAKLKKEKPKKPTLKKTDLHWQVMCKEQLDYLRSKGLSMKRVEAPKGSMVLWDSRTVHSSASYCATAPEGSTRLHLTVCMAPPPKDEQVREEQMKKRKRAYEEGAVSKHSPDLVRLFKLPRMYNKEQIQTHKKMRVLPSAPMNDEEKKLYGLLPY